jgi:hypothetical protein
VIDDETLAQINGKYTMPADAGPGWREASEAGIDMSLIESSLRQTPDERLDEHQQVLNFALEFQRTPPFDASR